MRLKADLGKSTLSVCDTVWSYLSRAAVLLIACPHSNGHGAWRAVDGARQICNLNHWSSGKCAGPLQAVLQLAHVAGPVVGEQGLHCLIADRALLAGRSRQSLQEMRCQQRDVLTPLTQRRNPQT